MRSLVKALAVAALLITIAPRSSSAQQTIVAGSEEVPPSEFRLNLEPPAAYAGDYHFGDSEWESTLRLVVTGERVTGRLTYSVWENERFALREVRLQEGRIVGAMLVASGWSGIFVRLGRQKGLVLFRAPREGLVNEFGAKLPWVRDQ